VVGVIVGSVEVAVREELSDTSAGGVVVGNCPGPFFWRPPGEITDIIRRIVRIVKVIEVLFIYFVLFFFV
jgi:hypothetical protein